MKKESAFDPSRRYGVRAHSFRRRLRYTGEIIADYLLYLLLRPLPLDWGVALSSAINGWLLPHTPYGQRVKRHLALAMPDISERERQRITIAVARYTGRLIAEYSQINRLFAQIETRCEVEGVEHIEAIKAQGRSMVFIGAHLGNWEIMAYWCWATQ